MRVLRVMINAVLCVSVAILISFTQIGLFDLMAAQTNRVDGIHISAGDDNEVGYFDAYTFWGTDIDTGIDVGAKYRVRNWFSWKWWKTSMVYVDMFVDTSISIFKPIIVPIAQVNAVADYYGRDINYFYQDIINIYGSEEEAKAALYELYVLYGKGYGEKPVALEGYVYDDITTKSTIENDINNEKIGLETSYARWVRNNKELYNIIWKLNKYNINNGETYGKYFNKFIVEMESGERSIKSAAIVLYYQNIVSIALAVLFIIKYPVGLFQARFVHKRHGHGERRDEE